MRVTVTPKITLTDSEGRPFPNAGYLNVFLNAEGAIITGKKSYASASLASSKNRTPANWRHLGTVRLEEYIPANFQETIKDEVKKFVIKLLDQRLTGLMQRTGSTLEAVEHAPTDMHVPAVKKLVEKKTAAKKSVAKRALIKKPAVKKAVKKPVAKKTAKKK